MRARILLNVVAALVFFVGVSMLAPLLLALADGSEDASGIGLAALVTLLAGGATWWWSRSADRVRINHREGFAIVGIGWLSVCLFGALPFLGFSHLSGTCRELAAAGPALPGPGWELCSVTDAVFESASGFTTTGASILTAGLWETPGVRGDGLPRAILLWRSLTHWLGGMGILVLAVAILPLLGVGGMQIMRAEVPGPTTDKLAPRIAATARVLWLIYAGVTLAEVLLLLLGGMNLFEAVCHAFATMATGGFSTQAKSAQGFESAWVEWVTVLFMFIAGASFSLHYLAVTGRARAYLRDREFRFYAGVVALFSVGIAVGLLVTGAEDGVHGALRTALFQVLTIVTTTGFASRDFEAWAAFAPILPFSLFFLMFFGGSAGSTGGGVKCVRVLLLIKQGWAELRRLVHPHAVFPVRLGTRVVERDVLQSVTGFFMIYMALIGVAATLFSLTGQDFMTALTAAAATVGNIGPGLGEIGPSDNYHFMTGAAKWLAVLCMLLGRLELYTLLVLFVPEFWRR